MQVLKDRMRVDSGVLLLGTCLGHDVYLGAGCILPPGRAVPNGWRIIPESQRVLGTFHDFYGCLYSLFEVLPHMIGRRSGHIVVVASIDGKKGIPPDGAYVASKFAISGLAEVLRQELHGTGVHLSTIFPGRIDTPMIADVRVPFISAKIPPERVADAIVQAVLKQRAEVLVPRLSSKTLILANALSPGMADRLVRRLRLGGLGGT